MTQEDVTYFINIAMIAATLLGLTFIALSFFLVDLLKRYKYTALPVLRHQDGKGAGKLAQKLGRPESLTDFELLDGDPLVVFIAFSVAVAWNLFLLPLTIGLTAAGGAGLTVLAIELLVFFVMLTFSFIIRNQKIELLKPYLTREELLWRPLSILALVLYITATITVVVAALTNNGVELFTAPAIWTRWGITNSRMALSVLKTICVVALLLGTYTVNKDMFIFFKSVAAERMRLKWLEYFLTDTYPKLKDEVQSASSDKSWHYVEELMKLWHDGCPPIISNHEAFRNVRADVVRALWQELVDRHVSTPGWIFDIPKIALWADGVEMSLKAYHEHTAARVAMPKGTLKDANSIDSSVKENSSKSGNPGTRSRSGATKHRKKDQRR